MEHKLPTTHRHGFNKGSDNRQRGQRRSANRKTFTNRGSGIAKLIQ